MDPISIAGLALSGGSLLYKTLAGDSAERERQSRMQRLLQQIATQRAQTLASGSREIVKGTQSAAGVSRQAAARRAAAAGVSGANAESYVLPGESNAYNRGTDALENFTTATNRTFDNAALNAEGDFANRPIAPDASDYLMEIGSGAMKFGQDREYLDAMNSLNTPDPKAIPVPTGSATSEPQAVSLGSWRGAPADSLASKSLFQGADGGGLPSDLIDRASMVNPSRIGQEISTFGNPAIDPASRFLRKRQVERVPSVTDNMGWINRYKQLIAGGQ